MTDTRSTVGIIFGGKSAEHEVSLQSAKNIVEALDRTKYQAVLIGIDKSWTRYHCDPATFLLNADDPERIQLNPTRDAVALVPQSNGVLLNLSTGQPIATLDVVFPILHGPFGEDGTIQWLLKLAHVPFVWPSILGSAVGMDKDVMKRLLRDAGIPIGKFVTVSADDPIPSYETIIEQLGSPLFIKPANMGSSVGVSKVHTAQEYLPALTAAFQYDSKVIVEEFIIGREIECSVLGNENPSASIPGEVAATHEFYSYEAKYLDENGAALTIPADLPPETIARVQALAVRTFQALCCEGLGRVDCFLKDNGDVLVNEINTMPGFTKISMYPKLWEASGISYTGLLDSLLTLAKERFAREKKLKTKYVLL